MLKRSLKSTKGCEMRKFKKANMEYVKCNLCGRDRIKRLFEKEGYSIVRCMDCGLVYMNPRPIKSKINRLYDLGYFQGKGFDKSVDYYRDFIEKRPLVTRVSKDRLALIKKYKKNGKLLDVGCAFGFLLEIAKEEGFEPYGLEVSPEASKIAREHGLNICNATLENSGFTTCSFDVINMTEVIEHLPDPMSALKSSYRLLKDNGVIVIQTGNVGSPKAKIWGKRWDYFIMPGHIYYFSIDTMKDYLKKAGFSVLRMYPPMDHESSSTFKILKPKKGAIFYNILSKLLDKYDHLFSTGLVVIAQKNLRKSAGNPAGSIQR